MQSRSEIFMVHDYTKIELLDDGRGALVLGYIIDLTKGEYAIVRILIDAKAPVHKSRLSEHTQISEAGLAVHISNINKKALPITGRKLLVGNRRGEYTLSENM